MKTIMIIIMAIVISFALTECSGSQNPVRPDGYDAGYYEYCPSDEPHPVTDPLVEEYKVEGGGYWRQVNLCVECHRILPSGE